jgi:integrase
VKVTKVKVIKKRDRSHYVLRWKDPDTGAIRQQTTQATTKLEALKEAGRLEEAIHEDRFDESGAVLWKHARERFERERLPELRPMTIRKYRDTLNEVEKLVHPHRLNEFDASKVSVLQSRMAAKNLRPATIHSRLSHLRAFLRWCEYVDLLRKAPRFRMPKLRGTGKMMRGRPISDAEFLLMLEATTAVVGDTNAPHWRHYLEGIWLSGLRLTESLELYWDCNDALRVDLSGRRPMLLIPAEYDKGGQDRRVPITPDFSAFLEQTRPQERVGRVFKTPGRDGATANPIWVSRVCSRIGKAAGVVVDDREPKKYASLHDLRRSFGSRWANLVPSHVLRELMRHASITTTLDYYVGQDADRTADEIWKSAASQPAGSVRRVGR